MTLCPPPTKASGCTSDTVSRFCVPIIISLLTIFFLTCKVYPLGSLVNIGGPNKIVETDESKFGRLKYQRGHAVKGQWVLGSVAVR